MENSSATSTETKETPKTFSWQTVFTALPVVLTLLGTVLAGASTGEMTQAQYFRSLAAQNQAKVADQWGFFQAKRIRGQNLQASADALPVLSRPDKIDPELVQTAAARLVQRLERAEKNVERLRDAVAKAENGLGKTGDQLRPALDALYKTVQSNCVAARGVQSDLVKALGQDDVRAAFAFVGTKKLPDMKAAPLDGGSIPDDVLKGIADRKSDSELAVALQQISEESLRQAIAAAEANARAFEVVSKPVNDLLERVDRLIDAEVRQAASFHQGVVTLDVALADVPEGMTKALQEVRAAGEAVLRSDAAVRAAAEELGGIGRAARYDYNYRRYERDARFNQDAAVLYELEARRNSVLSERYRTRSRQFFYGMLFAQAGAAIASLSLAAHRKNWLWALAGAAGIAAMGFSGYVYLFM
jgi:Domain of unknown function (DUF4337)